MNTVTHSSGDTDSLGAVSSLSDDLQPIVPLFLDLPLREEVLAKFDGPKRLAAEEIFQCGNRLTAMTDWTESLLLEALGCPIKTMGQFHDAKLPGLQRCQAFLRLVTRNAGLVETVPDRREVVEESARVLKVVGGSANHLEELQETKVDGYTAIDFIRLGEIQEASEHVRAQMDEVPVGQAAADDPFAGVAKVHISPTRLDMLIEGLDMSIEDRLDALGTEVAKHMMVHIDDCKGCGDAFAYRRQRLKRA